MQRNVTYNKKKGGVIGSAAAGMCRRRCKVRVLGLVSDLIIPLLIFYIVGMGLLMKRNVYGDFIRGAKDGLKSIVSILPTLTGLMVSVGVLRSSGALDKLGEILGRVMEPVGFPPELVPLGVVRLFSNSAATGLLLDLYKEYGTDSVIGIAASLMASSTETVFYTMSVYFLAAKVTKTRYTLAGALTATVAGIAASMLLALWM